jgi:demethylmenaquinone methyltransferase/2-methoxy-6-polyprenyl-1,4-benzoquinol methylase
MVESNKELVPKFFDRTSESYDKIVSRTTLGKDNYWKKEILEKIPKCDSILDLACGTGILTQQIAQKIPNAKIVGVDVTPGYLEIAKKKLASNPNISFVQQDAEKLNLNIKFDCITSSYIPKYCTAEILVKTCLNHLKPGGKIILHDFTYPKNTLVRKIWNLFFVILNRLGKYAPDWKEVFVELPKLIRSSSWVVEYETSMRKNGLIVERQSLSWGTSAILTGSNVV